MLPADDVALENGPITSPDDARVCWDSDRGTYYLRDSVTVDGKRTNLVFVGVSLGPIHRKGVLQIRIDPAAVRVEVGDKLRWIIHDINGQKDTTKIEILQLTPFWPFSGPDPNTAPATYTAVRDAIPPAVNFVETPGVRIGADPPPRPDGRVGSKYNVRVTFKENKDDPNSPELTATIDPDVVYNPPGF